MFWKGIPWLPQSRPSLLVFVGVAVVGVAAAAVVAVVVGAPVAIVAHL